MDIFIVSIDHKFQLDKTAIAMPLDGMREKLEALLQEEIENRHVTFIGEEAAQSPNRPTIAHKLASIHEPPIPWQNIDMTETQRRSAGIYDALRNRPSWPVWRGAEAVMIEQRIPEDDVREEFMVRKAIECAGRAESILVICGDMHTCALKQKFERCGHSADTDSSLIAEKNWVGEGGDPIDRDARRS
jgi:hypothetical protein